MKKIEIYLKNIILRFLLLFTIKSTCDELPKLNCNSKLLFIRLNRIGDALIITPLLAIVKDKLKCHITILADKKNHFIFSNNKSVDNIFTFRKGILGFIETIRFIKNQKYDAIIDTHDDVSTTVSFIIAFSGIKYRLGIEKSNRLIYSHSIKRKDSKTYHVIDRLLPITNLLSISYDKKNYNIVYTPLNNSFEEVDKYLHSVFPDKKLLFGINISAGSTSRFWGVDRFKLLLEVLKEYDINIILLSSPRDLQLVNEISNKKYPVYTSSSFDKFAAMISKLSFLFTPDTSIVHLASAFKVPLFGLFVKDTEDMIWFPYNSKYEYVITRDSNLANLQFDEAIDKFTPFFEVCYSEYHS